jgi:hypothetical protein
MIDPDDFMAMPLTLLFMVMLGLVMEMGWLAGLITWVLNTVGCGSNV